MCHKKWIAFTIILINYFRLEVFGFELDFNSVPIDYNESAVIVKSVSAFINYKLTWTDFEEGSTSAQLVVSLPPQLRLIQQSALPTRIRTELVDTNISIKIRNVTLIHQGFYSAFRVVRSPNGRVYVDERRDFYLNITGLSKHGDQCEDDSQCESNNCIDKTCLCNGDQPVLIEHKCYSGQPIGEKCVHSNQCKFMSGEDSECSYKTKCRCFNNSFAVNLPYHGKYCVQPKLLFHKCLYSEQCLAIGSNRYCDPDLTCQCIPGHEYKSGVGCVTSGVYQTLPSTYVWPLLIIAMAAHLH